MPRPRCVRWQTVRAAILVHHGVHHAACLPAACSSLPRRFGASSMP